MEIKDILTGLGVTVPEDKLAELDQAVAQHYLSREEHNSALENQRFEALLDSRISAAGARNPKAVRAMLDLDTLRENPSKQAVDHALTALKVSDGYLFGAMPAMAAGTGTASLNRKPDMMARIRSAALGN